MSLFSGSQQSSTPRKARPILQASALVAVAVLAATGCGSDMPKASPERLKQVVVQVHDSWAMPKGVLAEFTKETGYTLKVVTNANVAKLADSIALNAGNPQGDVVYGLDNTYGSRAVNSGALVDYTPKNVPDSVAALAIQGDAAKKLVATDFGDVCVNVDDTYFAKKKLAKPVTFDDLLKPAYKNMLAIPGASTSSTGLAWLLGTIAAKGDGWKSYWKALLANGAKIDPGWSDAYVGDFTQGGGKGTRPMVISYSTSPPFTMMKGANRPSTSALLQTCFRQVEYIGVLKGAPNEDGAKAFVNFMIGKSAQAAIPLNMYMLPANMHATIPADWKRWAPLATQPWRMTAADIASRRDEWVNQWRDLVRVS